MGMVKSEKFPIPNPILFGYILTMVLGKVTEKPTWRKSCCRQRQIAPTWLIAVSRYYYHPPDRQLLFSIQSNNHSYLNVQQFFWLVWLCCHINIWEPWDRKVYMQSSKQIKYLITRSLGALRAPTSRLRPFGPALGPSGLLDNVLHALRALRPCDPRNSVMMG